MRSSKNRSRGKPSRNRNNSPGNNLNRVFDSSGPEGKVRGTPQQIIDKYTQLYSDATLSNDRVAAENFQQHGEHYTRLLGDAQRAAEAKRLQSEQVNRDRQVREREEREARIARQESASAPEQVSADPVVSDPANMPQPVPARENDRSTETADAGGENTDANTGLVETPESKPKRRPSRPRKPRPPKVAEQPKGDDDAPKAAE